MKRLAWILPLALMSLAGLALAASLTIDRWRRLPNVIDSKGAVTLPNGWRIAPAGKHIKLPGDLLMKMQVTSDFSDYDRADPDELNRILWAALRPGETMPAPVRSLVVRAQVQH